MKRLLALGWLGVMAIGLISWRRPAPPAPAAPTSQGLLEHPAASEQKVVSLAAPHPGLSHEAAPRVDRSVAGIRRAIAATRAAETGDPDRVPAATAAAVAVDDEDLQPVIRRLRLDELVNPVGTALVNRWLATDPLKASTWLGEKDPLYRSEAMAAGAALAARPEALDAFQQAEIPLLWKDSVSVEAGRMLADAKPERALAISAGISDPALRTDLQQTVVHGWMTTDPSAAAAWIGTQPDPALRAALRLAAAKSIGLTDPDLAAVLTAR